MSTPEQPEPAVLTPMEKFRVLKGVCCHPRVGMREVQQAHREMRRVLYGVKGGA